MKKRLLTLVLAGVMVVGCSMPAFAADINGVEANGNSVECESLAPFEVTTDQVNGNAIYAKNGDVTIKSGDVSVTTKGLSSVAYGINCDENAKVEIQDGNVEAVSETGGVKGVNCAKNNTVTVNGNVSAEGTSTTYGVRISAAHNLVVVTGDVNTETKRDAYCVYINSGTAINDNVILIGGDACMRAATVPKSCVICLQRNENNLVVVEGKTTGNISDNGENNKIYIGEAAEGTDVTAVTGFLVGLVNDAKGNLQKISDYFDSNAAELLEGESTASGKEYYILPNSTSITLKMKAGSNQGLKLVDGIVDNGDGTYTITTTLGGLQNLELILKEADPEAEVIEVSTPVVVLAYKVKNPEALKDFAADSKIELAYTGNGQKVTDKNLADTLLTLKKDGEVIFEDQKDTYDDAKDIKTDDKTGEMTLERENYTLTLDKDGNLAIQFAEEFFGTLDAGDYSLKAALPDGAYDISFTIK